MMATAEPRGTLYTRGWATVTMEARSWHDRPRSGILVKAIDKVVSKGKKIAAHLLEASEVDLEFKNGHFTVAGTDKSVPFAQIALAAYVPHNYPIETVEPGLDETVFYDPTNFTYPAGAHIAEVEIDRDTGDEPQLERMNSRDVTPILQREAAGAINFQ
jgi:CO/xanthine dehydrogenase Mo-binding subunit